MISLTNMRRVDSWIGWPLATLVGLLPRSARTLPVAPREIVIVKLHGLGSLLVCAGVLRALRTAQPQARLTVVTLAGTAPAARMMPDVDEVLVISASGVGMLLRDSWRVWRELRRRRVDVIADIEYFSKLSTVFAAISGARFRFGFQLPAHWRRRLLDGGVAFREDIHFRECVARLFHPLGVDYQKIPDVKMSVPDEVARAAGLLLSEIAPDAKAWAVINPQASDLCRQRRWPLERFAGVATALLQRHADLHIAIPGTADEKPLAEQLQKRMPLELQSRVHVLAGRTNLPVLAAVLQRSQLVLTNDSGVMHVAAAVGAPLVALFGPESAVRYGPVGGGAMRVLLGQVPCGPCLCYMNHKRAPCDAEPAACMLAIPVADVLAACEMVMALATTK